MLLLVTDTSGKIGNVALVRAEDGSDSNDMSSDRSLAPGRGNFLRAACPADRGAARRSIDFSKTDIDALSWSSGPGSFTGLRVGLAAIKALAEILAKPIVPVSLLEVVAVASGREGKIEAVLEAGRGDVYAGQYEIAGGIARIAARAAGFEG